jgi:hypothetical protein
LGSNQNRKKFFEVDILMEVVEGYQLVKIFTPAIKQER